MQGAPDVTDKDIKETSSDRSRERSDHLQPALPRQTDFKGSGGDTEHGRSWCRGAFSWASLCWGLRLTGGWQGVEAEGGERTNRAVVIWPREKTASVVKFKGHRYKNTSAL